MNLQLARRVGILLVFALGLWWARQFLFALQCMDWDGTEFQAPVLVAGWASLLVLATSLVLRARTPSRVSESIWRGGSTNLALAAIALFALLLASFMSASPADLWQLVRHPLDDPWRTALGVLLCVPAVAPAIAMVVAASLRLRELARSGEARMPVAFAAFFAPWFLGAAAWFAFHGAERRILDRHVEGSADSESLTRWRHVAWIHAWPALWDATDHDASPTAPPPVDRERRAREAFEALTGFDFYAASPSEFASGELDSDR